MGSQTLLFQQFRCTLQSSAPTTRAASWVRANADALPSTSQVFRDKCKFASIRSNVEIQGFGLGSGLRVTVTRKWKSPRRHTRNAGVVRASFKLDPGNGGPDEERGIGRLVVNLAIAGGLTYLTITGKLGWVFDAFVSLWVSSLRMSSQCILGHASISSSSICIQKLQAPEHLYNRMP